MLNEQWAVVVPGIDRAGGSIEHFAGDGIMAIFNADGSQPDHAQRAARAAAVIVAAGNAVVANHPGWPVFRVGINTGPAVVGTVGAAARRSVATIGDTINTAARLMAAGEPGHGRRRTRDVGRPGARRHGSGARRDPRQGQAGARGRLGPGPTRRLTARAGITDPARMPARNPPRVRNDPLTPRPCGCVRTRDGQPRGERPPGARRDASSSRRSR